MGQSSDHEDMLSVVGAVISSLKPLSTADRADVLGIVAKLLKVNLNTTQDSPPGAKPTSGSSGGTNPPAKKRPRKRAAASGGEGISAAARIDLNVLVNWLKEYDEYPQLEQSVLDSGGDLLDRVVLSLGVDRVVNGEAAGLTSGDVQRFYKQLDLQLDQPSISRLLSGKGKAYFIGDGVRTKGVAVRYKLSRTGVQKANDIGLKVK